MTFRAPNRLRRDLEARPDAGTMDVMLFCAVAFGVAGAAVSLLWWLGTVYTSKAQGAETYRVPAACAALVQRHGFPDVLTREQAISARLRIELYRVLPGVSGCRAAVNREWKL